MSILGNPITLGGGGADLNIDFGPTPPVDTSKLWVPLGKKPDRAEITDIKSGLYSLEKSAFEQPWGSGNLAIVGNKLYVIGGTKDNVGYGSASRDITVYDLESGAKETIPNVLHSKSATDAAGHSGGCVYVHGNYIYIFGGYSAGSTTYSDYYSPLVQQFDTVTKTNTVVATLPSTVPTACCACVGEIVYIFPSYSNTTIRDVYIFNLTTKTAGTWKSNHGINIGDNLVAYGSKLYYFNSRVAGGQATSGTLITQIIDTETGSVTEGEHYDCFTGDNSSRSKCAIIGDEVFSFKDTGTYNSPSESVYKFSLKTMTYEEVQSGNLFPSASMYGVQPAVSQNDDIYINTNYWGYIWKFKASFPVQNNHLVITQDSFSEYSAVVINTKTAFIKVFIKKCYIGNENNLGVMTPAYVYNQETLKWEGVSGSGSEDIINALNIMGVN